MKLPWALLLLCLNTGGTTAANKDLPHVSQTVVMQHFPTSSSAGYLSGSQMQPLAISCSM